MDVTSCPNMKTEIQLLTTQLKIQQARIRSFEIQLETQEAACRDQINSIIQLYNIRNKANARAVKRFSDLSTRKPVIGTSSV